MPVRVLARQFSRQMLPLAALAGLVVALAPPLAYRAAAWPKLQGQAQVYATHLATALRALVARQPTLWRFDADKVLLATAPHRGQADIHSVRVTDCAGATIFAPDPARSGGGPEAWAPILSGDETVAWVVVEVDPSAERRALGLICLGSGLLGLLIAYALYRVPTLVVRRQAGTLDLTLSQLKGAEAALTESNRQLQARVEEAVGRAHQLSERVVRIQEEERRRIARDLHDSVGQELTALQLELARVRGTPEEIVAHLAEATRCSEKTLGEVRRVVHDLRPPELDSAPLPDILRAYVERFEVRTGLAASFRVTGAATLPEEAATCLLRVLQEALTNVARHAHASEVGVALELRQDVVRLEVFDDGAGFDLAALTTGSGLRGIRERCAFLQGTMEVAAQPEGGTRLKVQLPTAKKKDGEGA